MCVLLHVMCVTGADSVVHLTVEGLLSAVNAGIPERDPSRGHCVACLTGDYPVALDW